MSLKAHHHTVSMVSICSLLKTHPDLLWWNICVTGSKVMVQSDLWPSRIWGSVLDKNRAKISHIHFEPPSIKTTRGLDPVSSVHVSSCQAGRHMITVSRTHSIHQSGCSDWTTESFLVCVCECRSLYMMNVSWTEQHVRQFQLFYGKRAAGRTVTLLVSFCPINKHVGINLIFFLFSTEVLKDFRSPALAHCWYMNGAVARKDSASLRCKTDASPSFLPFCFLRGWSMSEVGGSTNRLFVSSSRCFFLSFWGFGTMSSRLGANTFESRQRRPFTPSAQLNKCDGKCDSGEKRSE